MVSNQAKGFYIRGEIILLNIANFIILIILANKKWIPKIIKFL